MTTEQTRRKTIIKDWEAITERIQLTYRKAIASVKNFGAAVERFNERCRQVKPKGE